MNSVEKVKAICKERHIAISKLERDCGFSNGYIGQLKKGSFPTDRAAAIAEYLEISLSELIDPEQTLKEAAESTVLLNEFSDLPLDQQYRALNYAKNSPINSNTPVVSDEGEREILSIYRGLTAQGRDMFIAYGQLLRSQGFGEKDNQHKVV